MSAVDVQQNIFLRQLIHSWLEFACQRNMFVAALLVVWEMKLFGSNGDEYTVEISINLDGFPKTITSTDAYNDEMPVPLRPNLAESCISHSSRRL